MNNSKEDILKKNSHLLKNYHEIKEDNISDNYEENISYSSKEQNNLVIKFKNNKNIVNSHNQDIEKKINALEKKADYLLFENLAKRKCMNLIKKEDLKNKSKSAQKINLRKDKNNIKRVKIKEGKNYQNKNYSTQNNDDIEYYNDLKPNLDEKKFKEKLAIKKFQIYNKENENEIINVNQMTGNNVI